MMGLISSNGYALANLKEKPTGECVIPDTVDGITVTSLCENALSYSNAVTKFILPETCKELGAYALSNCEKLEEVDMRYVELMHDCVLRNCKKLRVVWLSPFCKISVSAFSECYNIEEVHIGNVCVDFRQKSVDYNNFFSRWVISNG